MILGLVFDNPNYKGSCKLTGKVVIPYYDEHQDAMETKKYIEGLGGECLLLSGDISDRQFCKIIVEKTLQTFGKIDILVNDADIQYQ